MKFKVTITPYTTYPSVGNPFTLADDANAFITGSNFANGAGGTVDQGFLGDCEDQTQPVPGFRAAYQTVFQRFNLKNSVSLTVTRVHDSERDAFLFLSTHMDLVPRAGLVTVVATCTDGNISIWMPNAVIGKITRSKQPGVRMTWTYPITGNGPWLTTKPATS